MANGNDFDYQLAALPRRLVARQSIMVLTGLTALMAPVAAVGFALDIATARSSILVGGLAVTVVSIVVNRIVSITTGPEDRTKMNESTVRLLPPLPAVTLNDELEVALEPGWFARRKTDIEHQMSIDADGIRVPIWAINWVPRPLRRSGETVVTIRWIDIERWRVRSDSDGPDLYEIETRQPWFATEKTRWPMLQISRTVIIDEIALLDAVRAVGQISIDLETSLPQLAEA